MDRDIIAGSIDIIQVVDMSDLFAQCPCTVNGDHRIIAHNIHAQSNTGVGNADADGAKADHTDGLAHDLSTCKLFFAFFH